MTPLNHEKMEIAKLIESREEKFWRISDAIWSYAELALEELKSSKLLGDTLEAAGSGWIAGWPECQQHL